MAKRPSFLGVYDHVVSIGGALVGANIVLALAALGVLAYPEVTEPISQWLTAEITADVLLTGGVSGLSMLIRYLMECRVPEFNLSREQRQLAKHKMAIFIIIVVITHILGIVAICARVVMATIKLDDLTLLIMGIMMFGCAIAHVILNAGVMLIPMDVAVKKQEWYDEIIRRYMKRDFV